LFSKRTNPFASGLSKSDTTLASEIHQDQFAFIKPLSVESMKAGSIVGKNRTG